jgi:hypothetical protein
VSSPAGAYNLRQYHTHPVHGVGEAPGALTQIWTWRSDACQSSTCAFLSRERAFFDFANVLDQFANIDNLDFSDVQDKEPLQQFDVAVGREVGEYTLKYANNARSSNAFVSTLPLFLSFRPANALLS